MFRGRTGNKCAGDAVQGYDHGSIAEASGPVRFDGGGATKFVDTTGRRASDGLSRQRHCSLRQGLWNLRARRGFASKGALHVEREMIWRT